MDAAIDLSDETKALDLDNIRVQLIRIEDTITFHLIERVQFPLNATVYDAAALPIPNSNLQLPANISLVDYILSETERVHSLVRRYDAPDEHPFFPQALQRPVMQALKYPHILHKNDVNVNSIIKERYVKEILPSVCKKRRNEKDRGESKENYGSTAVCDVAVLQALSRRIHVGKFVAESKFRKEPEMFTRLIKAENREGIDKAITNAAVEKQIVERLRLKATTYGTDPASSAAAGGIKIDPEAVAQMYEQFIIPLTKVVEVEYMMQRLN